MTLRGYESWRCFLSASTVANFRKVFIFRGAGAVIFCGFLARWLFLAEAKRAQRMSPGSIFNQCADSDDYMCGPVDGEGHRAKPIQIRQVFWISEK